jgi:hypothetical protein
MINAAINICCDRNDQKVSGKDTDSGGRNEVRNAQNANIVMQAADRHTHDQSKIQQGILNIFRYSPLLSCIN